MATLVLKDDENSATALAELLYADIDKAFTGVKVFDKDVHPMLEDEFKGAVLLLDFLAANTVLTGCLSEYEVMDLISRANNIAVERNWDHFLPTDMVMN